MRRLMRNRLLAGFVVVAVLVPSVVLATNSWPDVPDDKFYTDAVAWAKDNGMTTGCDGGTNFCPGRGVSRGENITFAKRYDDLVVQPALDDVNTAIDANTTAASTAQATADTAQADAGTAQATADGAQIAAEDAQDTANEGQWDLYLSHSPWGLAEYDTDAPTGILRIDGGMEISGAGTVGLPIDGPLFMHGTEWTLVGVQYCIRTIIGDSAVDAVAIVGNTVNDAVGWDPTTRSEAGCYTLSVGDFPVVLETPEYNYSFNFAISTSGTGSLTVYEIFSWWTPLDSIIILAEGDTPSFFEVGPELLP